jgi:long-chain acyl-CoA synthetase
MTPARIAFSVPVVIAYTHAASAAPVFASHPLDLQMFPPSEFDSAAFARHAHVGPPTINIEAKLVGVNDTEVESGGDPVGVLVIKGPPVGRILGSAEEGDGWVETGDRGKVQTNGAFKVSFIGK